MKLNKKYLENNVAVWCNSRDQAKDLLSELEELGYEWPTGEKPTERIIYDKYGMRYFIRTDKELGHCMNKRFESDDTDVYIDYKDIVSGYNHMEEIARLFDVELGEEFYIIQDDGLSHGGTYEFAENGVVHSRSRAKTLPMLYHLAVGEYTIEKAEWKPKQGDKYYYVTGEGGVKSDVFHERVAYDIAMLDMGNCFRTRHHAEEAVPEMLAKFDSIIY